MYFLSMDKIIPQLMLRKIKESDIVFQTMEYFKYNLPVI